MGDLKYAYSLKKVVSGYTGSCIRVRRSSDDTEQDIGFSGDSLDSASLETFIGVGNGHVVTWYDQTETVNLTQATAAHQPAIVEEDSEWAIYFDGSSASMQLENAGSLTTATNSSLHVVWKANIAETSALAGFQFGSTDQQFQPWNTAGNAPYIQTKTSQTYNTNAVWDDGKWRQHQVQFHNGTMRPYEMGSPMGQASSKTNPDMAHFYVGGNNTTVAEMHVCEVVWFDAVNHPADVWEVTKNNYGTNLFSYTDLILHIGDSLTSGQFPGNGNEWTTQLHALLGTDRWHVRGAAGNPLSQWILDDWDLGYFGQDRFISPSSGSKVAIIWCGTNDITAGATGAETYLRLKELETLLRGCGFGGIVVMTILPRTETGVTGVVHADERAVFNTLIKADTDLDLVIDLDTNVNLSDETDSTYFQGDQVHLTAAGALQMANTVFTATSGFNFSNYSGGNMGITFAVRGDSLNARYSNAGSVPGATGNTPSNVNTNMAGINGSTSIDMVGPFATVRPLIYAGRENTPEGLPRSVLVRFKMASTAANYGLFQMGVMIRSSINSIFAYVSSAGEIVAGVANSVIQTDTGTTTGAAITDVATDAGSALWHDVLVTWTGDTTSNGFEVWVDGTRRLQDTMTRALPTFIEAQRLSVANIIIGATESLVNTHMYVDEFVVWDEVIDPATVALTTGTGLSGNARAAYVDVASFDGASSSGGSGLIGTGGITL